MPTVYRYPGRAAPRGPRPSRSPPSPAPLNSTQPPQATSPSPTVGVASSMLWVESPMSTSRSETLSPSSTNGAAEALQSELVCYPTRIGSYRYYYYPTIESDLYRVADSQAGVSCTRLPGHVLLPPSQMRLRARLYCNACKIIVCELASQNNHTNSFTYLCSLILKNISRLFMLSYYY